MKKTVFLIIFTAVSFCVSAQSSFFIKNNNIEKWYLEKGKIETEAKKAMKLPEFQNITKGNIPVEELLPYFHFIDFDNNGTADLIFSGKIDNVNYTFLFYKKGNSYLVAVEEKGTIIQANLPDMDNGLCFSLWKDACCGDYISSLTQYACISTNNTSYFNTMSKSLIYKGTVLPQVRNEKAVAFKTTQITHLRSEPIVNDEKPIAGKNSWKGNAVGIYALEATGTIYAEMRDSKNEFWYFVKMNNESGILVRSNRFTAEGNKDNENCFMYGWVNSNDITLIE